MKTEKPMSCSRESPVSEKPCCRRTCPADCIRKSAELLRNTSIRELDTNALVAGTIYHGQFEANLKALMITSRPPVRHRIHGRGSLNPKHKLRREPHFTICELHKALSRSRRHKNDRCHYNREYEGMNARDAALTRRFIRIDVPEPTRDEAIGILTQVASVHGRNTGVALQDGAIEAAIDLATRHVQDRRLPDKAIDLLVGCISRKAAEQPSASAGNSRAWIPPLIDLVGRN